ncbi:Tad domain-containing protein [Aneurinibacillus terranovensis]|uniref:Tad domain-containing protein n=1 Tax=Aneurinibacillus terranovensis TaxID=278991 RepID=UPI00048201EC|nr:Tad domain-containing protein [Aneurinibacillus terranovensis]
MITLKGFQPRYRLDENGEKGFAGFVFILMLFIFMIPLLLLEFDIGRNIIAKEGIMAATDSAVLAGANEVKRVDDAFGSFGEATSWHYEIQQPQALASAEQTFEKNVKSLHLQTNLKANFLLPSPVFAFPAINQMSGNLPFKVGMDDFNKANQVLNPSIAPSPDWVANGNSRSVFSQPKFQ